MSQLILAFSGDRSADAELTWSQRGIWELQQRVWPEHHHYNFARVLQMPAGTRLRDVLRCLERLVERYEAFRTTVRTAPHAGPRQHVADVGEYVIDVHEADDDQAGTTERLSYEYKGYAFRDDEWPLRVAIVTVAGSPAYVVLVASHLAVDRWGLDIACAALVRWVTAATSGAATSGDGDERPDEAAHAIAARQPVDQAAIESSPASRGRAQRAAEYWRRTLLAVPQTLFPFPPMYVDTRWSLSGELSSVSAAMAARALAARFGGSTSAVILTAAVSLLSIRTANTTVALRMFVANRHGAQARSMVGTCVQAGLFRVDLGDATFHELIGRTWTAAVTAYRHACYPPELIDEVIREVNFARGIDLDLFCHFSDSTDRAGPAGEDPSSMTQVLDALPETRYRPGAIWGTHQRFLLEVGGRPGRPLRLKIAADHRYLTRADVEAIARGIQTLLVEAMQRDFDLAEAAALTGVRARPRGPAAVLVDHNWVEPEAVAGIIRSVPGVLAARVSVDGTAAEPRLTGHVAVAHSGLGPAYLHRECVLLLNGQRTAMAPHSYRVHVAGPAPAGLAPAGSPHPGAGDLEDMIEALPLCGHGDGRSSAQ